jgi:hypothetical protein
MIEGRSDGDGLRSEAGCVRNFDERGACSGRSGKCVC